MTAFMRLLPRQAACRRARVPSAMSFTRSYSSESGSTTSDAGSTSSEAETSNSSESDASETKEPNLKATLRSLIPAKRELLAEFKKSYGDKVIADVRVDNVLGGMRGLRSLLWEGSVLDPQEGIRFHGRTIKDCQRDLPRGTTGTQMLPEAMFWLLLTGQVPTENQVRVLSRQLAAQMGLPGHVRGILAILPRDMHPMTKFAMGVAALNLKSKFAQAYEAGIPKKDYWETTFDDSIALLAKLPTIAATIYKNTVEPRSGGHHEIAKKAGKDKDWAQNFVSMLDIKDSKRESFEDMMRLYLALHGDHEGGNVSAHATHLVGSALSDPFLSYSAGLLGLAGPLHGLAAQEAVRYVKMMKQGIPAEYSDEDVTQYVWKTLRQDRVVPGYGHAVLRKPDPRFEALMEFGASQPAISDSAFFRLVQSMSRVVPQVLQEHGKTKNPFPNVDSISGVLFNQYGIQKHPFYTVAFGVSRGIGPLAQLIWDRALGLPIERPKSVSLAGLAQLVESSESA
ncbi:hypothetical protein L249_0950 [Ophiocordyceps polyrhachis-furcata BCC 54312]|uniref:Citrate synthase n=1 Tax=Ophiocordyceps polyrhachis-furcata BCC 54312 TaxID=1330021 RepID=A0A367LEW5_9HYPO|nr:hypothetical protein L249_0950 [Ophiocordyceps polyrhachis-furcata BCC 54312]